MGYIYSGSNTTIPVGGIMDYNNTNPSRGVANYRMLAPLYATNQFPQSNQSSSSGEIASAMYKGGSYSLIHPNCTSNILAQNVDVLA